MTKRCTLNLFGNKKTPNVNLNVSQDYSSDFSIQKNTGFVDLPKLDHKERIDVRYPLLAPYAYAHIYWDSEKNELVYKVDEPELTQQEKDLFDLIKKGLEEMINISFVHAAKKEVIIHYLEKNVHAILLELGTNVSKQSYQRLMYYIYRDLVGMGMIETLLNDYFIEDIECNGANTPIYIVHRVYENIRTNVIFNQEHELMELVEKLAQKSGRYVSFANPLLDGTLPDGSRVNATYTSDITTRGPTFTIRKFTSKPWTPVDLIMKSYAPARIFAYLWLAVEYKFNFIIIGETASGKTTFLNSIINFIPPEARVCSIEDTRELNLAHENWLPAVTRLGFGTPNLIGKQYGEVTLFDLLSESFRQNPDYVIVGEIRGKEAYVLFQGMASGHPSFGTFHAGSVETLVRRLENEPINLPPSLIETIDLVCYCAHIKGQKENVRRLVTVNELKEIDPKTNDVDYNEYLKWNPSTDTHEFKKESVVIQKIHERSGLSFEKIQDEIRIRTKLLEVLAQRQIKDFNLFNEIINRYYKNPESVIMEFNL